MKKNKEVTVKPNKTLDALAMGVVQCLIFMQEQFVRLACRLERKLSARQQKTVLIIGILVGLWWCVTTIYKSAKITPKGHFIAVNKQLHIRLQKRQPMINSLDEYISRLMQRLDSIKRHDSIGYGKLLKSNPGLVDTIELLRH